MLPKSLLAFRQCDISQLFFFRNGSEHMLKYIGKRLLAMIPVILGVTLIVYCIMSLAPGDPARSMLG